MLTEDKRSSELLSRRMPNRLRLLPLILDIDFIGRDSVVNSMLLSHTGVLIAPAGYGKTFVLARTYAELVSNGLLVAWMSPLDDDYNFHQPLCYILSGLRGMLGCSFGVRTEALARANAGTISEVLIDTLVAEITECELGVVLIIDDVHLLHDVSTLQLLAALIRRAPLRLMLRGRSLPIILNAAIDWLQVLEVRVENLRLSMRQAVSYYQKLNDTILDEAEAVKLYQQTEGWQAGIRLLASSANSGSIPAVQPIPSSIQNYLETVVNKLSCDAKKVVLAISILNYFSASVAGELAQCSESKAQKMIVYLCDHEVFIVQGHDRHGWHKIHSMFREYLLIKLQACDASEICSLHHKAALWYERETLE